MSIMETGGVKGVGAWESGGIQHCRPKDLSRPYSIVRVIGQQKGRAGLLGN